MSWNLPLGKTYLDLFSEQVHKCRTLEQQIDELAGYNEEDVTKRLRLSLQADLLTARGFALDTAIRIIQNGGETMTTIPRISGQPMTLEQLIRREYESMVNHGISPKLAEDYLRISIAQCSENARKALLPQFKEKT